MDKDREGKNRGLWRPILLIALIIAALVTARLLGLGERLGELQDWIESLGFWGNLAFVGIYIVAVVTGMPGGIITIAAGMLFGSVAGIILVSVGSTVGASLAFLIARYFARDAIARWLSNKEKFNHLDQLTEDHGAIIVAVTRLIPIFPFNLLNYGLGLTRVRFVTYVFWSWLCMLPGTIVYIVGTDAFANIAQGRTPWTLIGILVVVIFILIMLGVFARRKLRDKEEISAVEK